MTATVAALYIDPRGPYPRLNQPSADPLAWGYVHCYDATRDARLYAGPHPVVAHPPCKHWGRLRHLAHIECPASLCRYVGPGAGGLCLECFAVGLSDRDCAPRAVEQVRAFGGVLEHPAGSKLWEACNLPPPGLWQSEHRYADDHCETDAHGGYAVEVNQCEWGHVARKRTWLYLVGVPREALEAPPFPGREPTRSVSGRRGRATQAKHPSWREQLPRASDTQRRLTPPLFAEYLVRLARAVRK